jgi:hypothetical protein
MKHCVDVVATQARPIGQDSAGAYLKRLDWDRSTRRTSNLHPRQPLRSGRSGEPLGGSADVTIELGELARGESKHRSDTQRHPHAGHDRRAGAHCCGVPDAAGSV